MDSFWIPYGFLRDSCWIPLGFLLVFLMDSSRIPLGIPLGLFKLSLCIPSGFGLGRLAGRPSSVDFVQIRAAPDRLFLIPNLSVDTGIKKGFIYTSISEEGYI